MAGPWIAVLDPDDERSLTRRASRECQIKVPVRIRRANRPPKGGTRITRVGELERLPIDYTVPP
jgi:hypothetical protein